MKRRNAETGKMRRPVKRTKITEGMYGNSMLYLKFVMLWATVVMADYMLEFRFEFLWPFWMMLRSVYDSFKYQGLAFSVFFICIALTSDMICFFFIPLQYVFFAASTYVWVQYCWYNFADKGICLPTVIVCCLLVYIEGVLRGQRGGIELWCRPLAAHCVGYPVVTLGFGVKSYVGHRLRLRRQRQVREENEFYFQLMRDALPESAMESQVSSKEGSNGECQSEARSHLNMNGSVRRKCKPELNGQEQDAHTHTTKLEKEKVEKSIRSSGSHCQHNGSAGGAHPPPPDIDDRHDSRSSAKSSKFEKKEASTIKEEKKKNRNKDKDKDNNSDSHKGTEQTKEQIVKEVESTKENHIRNHKDCNSFKEKEKDREREKEREREREKEKERDKEREKEREREREKEKEKEREREREKELRCMRECAEELKRVRLELAVAVKGEAEARRALQAAAAAERQAKHEHTHLKHQHQQLQHKVSVWRSSERAALERRLGEERRARSAAEHQLRQRHAQHNTGECENESCRSQRSAGEAELCALRRDLRRATDRADQLQRDLANVTEQVRSLERRSSESLSSVASSGGSERLAGAVASLTERAQYLERTLSAETRVKLDLLQALGDAKRQIDIQEGLISRQEKEMEELKAQMLAVMPTEYVTPVSGGMSKRRLENSALDPNASVYTPKQLCSDA